MSRTKRLSWTLSLAFLDVAVIAAIAYVSVEGLWPYYAGLVRSSFQPSFFEVLPDTIPAALRMWAFWGAASVILGGWLLRWDPSFGYLDALLGGALGLWILAYVGANLIGPLGLCRSWVIWLLLLAALVPLLRRPPVVTRPTLTTGERLMLIAIAILTPGLLLLELGSPVPPHFDVFAPAAAAQRIVTFATYLPYDNDPYGYYDAASQCPGTEVFYAMLTLGSGTPLAVLAETSAIVPMAVLLIIGTYHLGKTIAGDVAGGFAPLFLFATVLFRMMPTGHGRYAAFVPAVAGLAFFLDERRSPLRLALGALLLGTAVAAHAIIGAFAMLAVAGTVIMWILRGDLAAGLVGIGLLAGASMIAVPTIAVGLRLVVPYPVLPLAQMVGIAIVAACARVMPRRAPRESRWLLIIITVVVAALIYQHPTVLSTLQGHWASKRYPILYVAGVLGIAVALATNIARVRSPVVMILAAGLLAEYASNRWQAAFPDPRVSIAIRDLAYKADFWYPFALIFPAACLLAALARVLPRRLVVYALLAVLAYPYQYGNMREGARDPNYYQNSIVEGLAEQLAIAKAGYWGGMGHRRWAQNETELQLMDTLRAEIAAGRITTATHIAHLSPIIYLYRDVLLFSVFVGINDDIFMAQYQPDPSIVGGRIRPAENIVEALGAHPPYVVLHDVTANAERLDEALVRRLPLDDYELIFVEDGIRMFRLRSREVARG